MYVHVCMWTRTPPKALRHSLGHALYADGEVLSHGARLDGLHTHLLQACCKLRQGIIVVQLGAVCQSTCPSIDGSCGADQKSALNLYQRLDWAK